MVVRGVSIVVKETNFDVIMNVLVLVSGSLVLRESVVPRTEHFVARVVELFSAAYLAFLQASRRAARASPSLHTTLCEESLINFQEGTRSDNQGGCLCLNLLLDHEHKAD